MGKEIYQLLVKGTATNKLTLLEFNDYENYRDTLNSFRRDRFYLVITTNTYI